MRLTINDKNEDMILTDPLTERIKAIAKRKGRTPEDLLRELLDEYEARQKQTHDPIEDFIGAFDDDVTDLSTTVRETLHRKFRQDDDSTA